MNGINYLVDEKGKKTAVQIDLLKYGEVWEDFCDCLTAKERENQPRMTLNDVKGKLIKSGKSIED